MNDPFSDFNKQRRKGYTVAGPSRGSTTKNKMENLTEIKNRVNAGISNLTYYKADLAIDEFEEALSMLKDQI